MHPRQSIRVIAVLLTLALFALPLAAGAQSSETNSSAIEQQGDGDACPACPPCAQAQDSDQDGDLDEQAEEEGPVCHGILTCTFRGVGWILAIPFRLIGVALEVII